MVSLCDSADPDTTLTPPHRNAVTAILCLDRTRGPVACDDPIVGSAPTHMARPETRLLEGVLVAVQLRAAALVSIVLTKAYKR